MAYDTNSQWKCRVCTFENSPHMPRCEMCLTNRNGKEKKVKANAGRQLRRNEPPRRQQAQRNQRNRKKETRAVARGRKREDPFGPANTDNKRWIIGELNRTDPLGKTKLRDAILGAMVMTRTIKEIDKDNTFTYVNVVITDGEDTGSKTSTKELMVGLYALDRLLGKASTTFLVGVGERESNFTGLKVLATLLDTVHFKHIKSNDCSEIFQRIQIELGIRRRVTGVITGNAAVIAHKDQLVMGVAKRRFVVLFTIDKSGSMSGSRWRSTCAGITNFLGNLTEEDLFGVQVFSDDVDWMHM